MLESARTEVDALRSGGVEPAVERGLILRVTNAIDRALRRLLRDAESADLTVRLKALAPDELDAESVLGELRRIDRISVELAAGVHELFQLRRRLDDGAALGAADRSRAIQVYGLLESEARGRVTPTPATTPEPPPPEASPDRFGTADDFDLPAPPPALKGRRARRRSPIAPLLLIAAALVLIAFGAVRYFGGSQGDEQLQRGLALFEQGEYREAAQYFWRYAEANPDDATPHLYLARIHRRERRTELAAEAIRDAERIAPDDPAVRRELGFLLLDTGRPDVAVDRFQEAMELDDESLEGWIGLVRALRESGRGAEADSVVDSAPAEVRALLTPANGG